MIFSVNDTYPQYFRPIGLYCRAITLALWLVLSGCAHFQPLLLSAETIQSQLQTPTIAQLTIQAAEIKHPLLEPIKFDMEDGLSPAEAAILAILRNPDLRAIRDQHGIANAQLLQAGLLPDPQFSYTFAAPSGGTDLGMNNAFGLGLSWQATALDLAGEQNHCCRKTATRS